MSKYVTEGFIKKVMRTAIDLTFTIDPASPYMFVDDKSNEAKGLIFLEVKGDGMEEDKASQAFVFKEEIKFQMYAADYPVLLIAKANHMKVRFLVDLPQENKDGAICGDPLIVSALEVL